MSTNFLEVINGAINLSISLTDIPDSQLIKPFSSSKSIILFFKTLITQRYPI